MARTSTSQNKYKKTRHATHPQQAPQSPEVTAYLALELLDLVVLAGVALEGGRLLRRRSVVGDGRGVRGWGAAQGGDTQGGELRPNLAGLQARGMDPPEGERAESVPVEGEERVAAQGQHYTFRTLPGGGGLTCRALQPRCWERSASENSIRSRPVTAEGIHSSEACAHYATVAVEIDAGAHSVLTLVQYWHAPLRGLARPYRACAQPICCHLGVPQALPHQRSAGTGERALPGR